MATAITQPVRDEASADNQVRTVTMRTDVYENDAAFLVVADVPGVTTDRVTIDIEAGELRIQAQRASQSERPGVLYQRSFRVGAAVDATSVSAELKYGVLSVTLPKSAALKAHRIEVTAS